MDTPPQPRDESVPTFSIATTPTRVAKFPPEGLHVLGSQDVHNPNSVGRQSNLQSIGNTCSPDLWTSTNEDEKLKVFIIIGHSGIGKTQIVKRYIHTRKQCYNAIFWIDAKDRDSILQSIERAAIALKLQDQNEIADTETITTRFKSWLRKPLYKSDSCYQNALAKWLIVFDDVNDPQILMEFWPAGANGSVTITTRNPTIKEPEYSFLGNPYYEKIKPFTVEGSVILLRKHIPIERREYSYSASEICRATVTAVECIPAAIVQIPRIVRHWLMDDLEEFLDPFNDEKVSSPLSVVAFLDPVRIPEGILTAPPQGLLLYNFPQTIGQYEQARMEFAQEVMRAEVLQIGAARNQPAFKATVQLLSSLWPFATTPQQQGLHKDVPTDHWATHSRSARCKQLLPHIRHLMTIFADSDKGRNKQDAQEICLIMGDLHGTRAATASMSQDLGLALQHAHPQKYFQEKHCESSGISTLKLAESSNDLAKVLMAKGQFARAAELLQKSETILKELPEYTRVSLFSVLGGWAWIHIHASHSKDAVRLFRAALKDREDEFGADDIMSHRPRTGNLFFGLGCAYEIGGDIKESRKYLYRALIQYRFTTAHGHLLTAKVSYKLALNYMQNAPTNYSEAKNFREHAAKVYKAKNIRPEITRTTYTFRKLLRLDGDEDEGRIVLDEAVRIRRSLVKDDVRDVELLHVVDFDELVPF
ncbi:P-loop containing nucleoside triphosphate hydrolase protein [Halenospora varia]|nr:P-loop containing nucleoside triphosphate hydrolase protein [Halenospora varia]